MVEDTVTIDLVVEFHEKFGQPIKNAPDVTDFAASQRRLNLLAEELEELGEALGFQTLVPIEFQRVETLVPDPIAALKELTDLQYVVDGTYVELGVRRIKNGAFVEVHRSNMSKLGPDGKPIVRADGKILKPDTYSPADLANLMRLYYG